MRRARMLLSGTAWAAVSETAGFAVIAAGLREIYPPAALIFAGAALVFLAQGMGRRE